MNNKNNKGIGRVLVNEIAWLAVLFAVVGAAVSSRYLTGLPDTRWWQYLYVLGASAGVFFIGHFLLQLLLVLPLALLSHRIGRVVACGLTFILLVALVTDTFVYQQYRFHINWAMIDLVLVGGREVFSFPVAMMIRIMFLICVLGILTAILVWGASKIKAKALWSCFAILLCYLNVNLVNAYSVAQNVKSVTILAERVPLYFPIRANTLLSKFGLVVLQDDQINYSNELTTFRYPFNSIEYGKGEHLNVLIVAIDSLRSDVVTPLVMPNLTKIAEKGVRFQDHYSAGNATRSGIFGLFYGLPPFYWQVALSSSTSPALMNGFIDSGYDIGVFSTATLKRPEFYSTVFSRVKLLRMGSTGSGGVIDRDRESVADFEKWLLDRDADQKFMSFIFLDSVHAAAIPEELEVPYKDYWKDLNHLELSPDFDPVPYFNRYKNSAYGIDILIGEIIDILREKKVLDKTIVIVTSDHGDEFNDSGLNYWGHNGNFSVAQIKIPLVIYWPGMQPQEINYRTTAYDVSATLLKRVLAVQNPIQDFSVGQDLFDSQNREVFFVGSYNEDAIVAGDEVLLIKMSGALVGHSLKDWKEIDAAPLKKWVPTYLQMRGKYRQ